MKVEKLLETIGTTTLADSLKCAKEGGAVCMMGMVGDKWSFDNFSPMETVPSTVNLRTYSGSPKEFMATPIDDYLKLIVAGKMSLLIGKVFHIDDIVEASRTMEENKAGGKKVVLM